MNDEVRLSRQIISRRRALGLGGTIGLGGLLAACGADSSPGSDSTATTADPSVAATASTAAPSDIVAALDGVPTCALGVEETQGPYWFDVDSIRSDLREDRPGTLLTLATRVQDVSACSADGSGATPMRRRGRRRSPVENGWSWRADTNRNRLVILA